MSRSYHKVWVKVGHSSNKKWANRKVRRSTELYQGGEYRKLYDSWNICDWRFGYMSERDCVRSGMWDWRTGADCTEAETRRVYRIMRSK